MLGAAPLFVAEREGWLSAGGLSSVVALYDSGPNAVQAAASGTLAQAEFARLLDLSRRDEAIRADTHARTDAASVMFAKTDAAASHHVGTNGGTAAGLVGSYTQVAECIRAFHAAGIELFMLQFQPFEAEMARFAEHVFSRVRG